VSLKTRHLFCLSGQFRSDYGLMRKEERFTKIEKRETMKVRVESFGNYNGNDYDEIIIQQDANFEISFSNLGARINSWKVPNEAGELESIIMGDDDAAHAFEGADFFYGATVGRVAGRIDSGRFKLEGETYQLPVDDEGQHLHGGPKNFDLQRWDYEIVENESKVDVIFEYTNEAGTNGYPGNLDVEVTHTVSVDNQWTISYKATTDETTLFNPTNHVYFNLNGNNQKTIENHVIAIDADNFLPVDDENVPTGEIRETTGTPFDLKNGEKFDDLLESDDEQFNIHQGFDHPFLLNESENHQAKITVPEKDRSVYMKTDEPAVIVFTQNEIPTPTKVWGNPVQVYSGITLETQKEPDAINQPTFSSIVLEPGEVYESQTEYWVETDKKGDGNND